MALLHPIRVSTSRFTYANGVYAAEESDFGRAFRLERVYDDACDVGLTLVSHITGREIVFAVWSEERREGELLWTELRPAPYQPGLTPVQKNLAIHLFND